MFSSSNIFRIKEINSEGQRFINNSVITIVFINFVIMLSNSIYILFTLQILNDSNAIFQLSLLLCFLFIVITVTDYPTSFITKFNQKQILIIASILYLIGFYVFSIATNFFTLLIAFFFIGIAQGQESDAFRRYFEDNYYFYVSEDSDRIIYNSITFRMNLLLGISTVISFVLGGIISFYLGRAMVFDMQVFLLVFVFLMIYFLLKEYPNKEKESETKKILPTLKKNLSYCWSNQSLRYFVIGSAITSSTLTIFGTLVIFTLYEDYTPNDLVIGTIRASILVFGAIFTLSELLIKNLIKKKAWIIFIAFVSSFSLFFFIDLFTELFSPTTKFDLILLVILTITIAFAMFPQTLYKRSKDSYLLYIVPEKRKEDVFSFLPLVMNVVNIPMIVIGGYLIQNFQLPVAITFLLIIALLGTLVTSRGYYLFNYRIPKKRLITRTLNLYFGEQFEINNFTTIQLPVKYIWQEFTFSATKMRDEIVTEALKDGSLTSDEKALIEKILVQVRAYGLALEDIIEDAIITIDEEKRLDYIREQLFDIVFTEAKKDGIITDEEYIILNVFKKYLENFKGFSHRTDLNIT